MPVRYGGVNYPNVRYGGVNYPNVRYGGVTYPLGEMVVPVYSTVTVNLRDFDAASTTRILWNENTSLGTTFSGDGLEQILDFLAVYDSGRVRIPIFGANRRFTPAFESTGRFIVTASDGETVEFLLANADLTETYDWTPTNSAEITAFVSHVRGLTDGDATLTLTMETIVLAVAPAFADDTGNAQTWTQSFAISAITVPEATGTPTPTYAAVGTLPAGITFNATTRVISGTPTAIGSGTITIRAANSAGTDDWTVAYTIAAAVPSLYSTVTVNLTGYTATGTQIRWDDNVALPPTFDLGGNNQTLSQVILRSTNAVSISILGTNRRWTPEFEATGRIIFTASDGETLEVMIANADMTEPYAWFPTNGGEITLFVAHVRALADHDATLTLTDEPVVVLAVAPAFADSAGDAQTWTQNTAITPITVPEATGDPVPTYAAVDLPSGITFDAGTRVISGTPTTAGSGTATVTATNSAGTDDWTVAYTIAAALTLRPAVRNRTVDGWLWQNSGYRRDTRRPHSGRQRGPALRL